MQGKFNVMSSAMKKAKTNASNRTKFSIHTFMLSAS